MITAQREKVSSQIASLKPTVFDSKQDVEVHAEHELHLTMVDGKVAKVLTGKYFT